MASHAAQTARINVVRVNAHPPLAPKQALNVAAFPMVVATS
jgi:hypothetical protein